MFKYRSVKTIGGYYNKDSLQRGFTLIELIMVLVLASALSAAFYSRISANASMQLQATRDQIISTFRSAQQLSLAQSAAIQVRTTASSIDIRQDLNGDNTFSAAESIRVDGVQYPLTFASSQSLSPAIVTFDNRLGRTDPTSIVLSQASSSITLSVSAMGVVY